MLGLACYLLCELGVNGEAQDGQVVVHLNDDHLIVCLPLLERGEAQQAQFALPGLSQPVAWAMARSVEPSPGDVIVDPMCGSGIVLFEAAQCWRGACYLGFDVDASQLERSGENLAMLAPEVAASLAFARGDARRLPLSGSSVDAVVCDMPFGKQYGTEADNLELYPAAVAEFCRVLRPSGRAALLTNQANAGRLAEALAAGPWHVLCRRKVLLGHMEAVLFLAMRAGEDAPACEQLETKDSMRLPWEDQNGRRTWSSMKASLRQPMRAVAGGKKSRR
ncbi:Thumpd3 [Symbiodinium sp. CCMP2592]|nr:Thumpd3 [Symbiodinium sp. CCMP2592]